MSNILIFLGVPGAGKGTQSKKISQEFNYLHVSTGDLLRKEVAQKTVLGLEIESIISKGQFVNDELISKLVLVNMDLTKNYIFDGFPRNLNQAKTLDEYISKNNSTIEKVIYLDLLEEDIVKRLIGRRVCKNCKKEFNVFFTPDLNEKCKYCGTDLEKRSDDTEEVVKNRLEVYKKETYPIIEFYKNKGLLKTLNASDTIENVYKLISFELI